jgi:hypothetical protein
MIKSHRILSKVASYSKKSADLGTKHMFEENDWCMLKKTHENHSLAANSRGWFFEGTGYLVEFQQVYL